MDDDAVSVEVVSAMNSSHTITTIEEVQYSAQRLHIEIPVPPFFFKRNLVRVSKGL